MNHINPIQRSLTRYRPCISIDTNQLQAIVWYNLPYQHKYHNIQHHQLHNKYNHISCTNKHYVRHQLIHTNPLNDWRKPSQPSTTATNEAVGTINHTPSPIISPTSWINSAPHSTQPYLYLSRIDKPIGTYLLYLPCIWGVALATNTHNITTALQLSTLLYIGAISMRGAGCTVNDIWDRSYDRHVSRTQMRPIACGQVSVLQGSMWMVTQVSIGCLVVTQLDIDTIILSCLSLPVVVIYPLMKRYTYWPQFILGIAFNWGVLVGYSAMYNMTVLHQPSLMYLLTSSTHTYIDILHTIQSHIINYTPYILYPNNMSVLTLYCAGICWTILYDTIYAFQDIRDDTSLGLKSTAILFYSKHRQWLYGFAALTIGLLITSGIYWNASIIYYTVSVCGTGLHFLWQISTLDKHSRSSCSNRFISNKYVGAMVGLGILLDRLVVGRNKTQSVVDSAQPNNTIAAS